MTTKKTTKAKGKPARPAKPPGPIIRSYGIERTGKRSWYAVRYTLQGDLLTERLVLQEPQPGPIGKVSALAKAVTELELGQRDV